MADALFLLLLVLAPYALAAPALLHARRRATLAWMDPLVPAAALVVWVWLATLGVGTHNLDTLLELPLVVLGVAAILSARVFVVDGRTRRREWAARLTALLCILLPLVARLTMPFYRV